MRKVTRLCSSKPIVTINGKFPGPTIYAREGDNVLVKVVNHVPYNVSIHWLVFLSSNFNISFSTIENLNIYSRAWYYSTSVE